MQCVQKIERSQQIARPASRGLVVVLVFLTWGLVGGCMSSSDDPTAGIEQASSGRQPGAFSSQFSAQGAAPAADAEVYRVGAQDVLEISVFQVPELTRSVQVAGDGSISLPLVGTIRVSGKTPREVEGDLATKLKASYLQSPQVSVYVKEFNSHRFTVEGAVNKPGIYPVTTGQTSLLRAIAIAQGFDRVADTSNVVIFRNVGDQRKAARFDVAAIRSGQTPDPEVMRGDLIVVDSSGVRSVLRDVLQVIPAAGLFVTLL